MATIKQVLILASQELASHSDSPRLDAELLLADLLECSRTHLFTWPDKPVKAGLVEQLEALLVRRKEGEPVAYLLGYWAFWDLRLKVNHDTLVPRPETELLVEQALARLPAGGSPNVVDMGTGTGAIALAVASECPRCEVLATDQSQAALQVARDNAANLSLGKVRFRQGNWCDALGEDRFDLILSNPPYVAEGDPHLLNLRSEPVSALSSGVDGLDDLRCIIAAAPAHLRPSGWLMLEHGYDQQEPVQALLREAGFASVETFRDYAGQPRVSLGQASLGQASVAQKHT